MRYIFKILILGDVGTTLRYTTSAFQEEGTDKGTYFEWYIERKILDDICDLEVVVITDLMSADFDEIMPSVDGIIYFLNPLFADEFEFFEMVIPIIDSVKRDIPTIINFYDPNGILPISTGTLLEAIWLNFPQMEVFTNTPIKKFKQILECLCLSMLSGDPPLNLENAWMRFPVFIKLANMFYEQQNFFYSALAIKQAATVAEIYKKEEFFIFCEQAAFLFAKISLYLEASQILNKADKKKSKNFKKLYGEAMIREGNKLFNARDFEMAARQYESAAQWTFIELKDRELIQEAFKLAINSWISACKCGNAFKLFERLPHEQIKLIMNDVADKIIAAADYLVSINSLESAKMQLYMSITTYQREGLFEHVEKFSRKLIDVLIEIFKNQIDENDAYSAQSTYFEIENLWETFKIEKQNIDSYLEQIIKTFIKELNFSLASLLINKLESLEIKQKLTEMASDIEEAEKESRRQDIVENIQKGIDIVKTFVEIEKQIIKELSSKQINLAKQLTKQEDFFNAANILKKQSQFLKGLGKDEESSQILKQSLDILVEGKLFSDFFVFNNSLSVEMNKSYLEMIFPMYLQKLKEFVHEEESFEKKAEIIEFSNKIYRNNMLYEQSKDIGVGLVKVIKREALRIVNDEENLTGIQKATSLIKKVIDFSISYLDIQKFTFNKIYKKIAEIYIELDDLSSAHAYNDKIEKKEYKTEIHKIIAKLEGAKSAIKSKEAEDTLKGEILKEKLSIIKKKARDAFNEREADFRKRRGLRRAYFNKPLACIEEGDYDNAIDCYKDTIIRMNRIKNYNLAGVSLALASLMLMKENKINEMVKLVEEIKKELAGSGKLFSGTFAVTLIDYIIDIEKLKDEPKLNEALSYIENLPLFEIEVKVLYDYLGKELKKEEVEVEKPEVTISAGQVANYRSEINKIARTLKTEKQDIAKRKMMKRQYWEKGLQNLSQNKVLDASLVYLDAVPKLTDKKFYKHAAIGLILGSLMLMREKGVETAQSTFDKNIKSLYHNKDNLEKLPEIQLMKYVFIALEHNIKSLKELLFENLTEKLYLFDPELDFLKSLTGEVVAKIDKKPTITREERGELSKLMIQLNQTYGNLQQKSRDIKSEAQRFFTKRKAMRRRYYEEILTLLNNKSYKEVANKYSVLAKTFSKRRDFETSAFLILLYELALIRAGESVEQLKADFDRYIESLGLSRKLIGGTFYIVLLLLLFDVKLNEIDEFIPKIRNLLLILPFFDEEKDLTRI
jgi:hypothetical protein